MKLMFLPTVSNESLIGFPLNFNCFASLDLVNDNVLPLSHNVATAVTKLEGLPAVSHNNCRGSMAAPSPD